MRALLRACLVGLVAALWTWPHPSVPRPQERLTAVPPQLSAVPRSDATAIRLLDAVQPGVHVLRALSRDLDRDGDLDVVASTAEEPVVIWINDGNGHFTRQRPASGPLLESNAGSLVPGAAGPPQIVPPPRWSNALPIERTVEHVHAAGDLVLLSEWHGPPSAALAHRPVRGPPSSSLIA